MQSVNCFVQKCLFLRIPHTSKSDHDSTSRLKRNQAKEAEKFSQQEKNLPTGVAFCTRLGLNTADKTHNKQGCFRWLFFGDTQR
jgi:hypothetical protein